MSVDSSHTVESIGPLHSLYIGSGRTGILSPEDRQRILDLCCESFSSFTCIEARGYFRGHAEETLLIQVATSDVERPLALAREIALSHEQLGVGATGPDVDGNVIYQPVIPRRPHGVET